MSLRISNLATARQKAILIKYDYHGTGKYAIDNLTVAEAAEIIDGLFEEQRLHRDDYQPDYFNQEEN